MVKVKPKVRYALAWWLVGAILYIGELLGSASEGDDERRAVLARLAISIAFNIYDDPLHVHRVLRETEADIPEIAEIREKFEEIVLALPQKK